MKTISVKDVKPGQVLANAVGEGEHQRDSDRKVVLLVDDNMTNLTTGKEMLKDHYKIYPAPSAKIMFDLLEHIIPDMILLDIAMPDINGYEAIKRLKNEQKWSEIPVMFLTSKTDEGSELEGLTLGAIDYVTKPFSAPLLLKRIENHLITAAQKKQLQEFNTSLKDFNTRLEAMVRQKTMQIFNLQNAVLSTVADLIEFRDDITGGHGSRSQKYLKILVDKLIEDKIYTDEIADWDMDYLLPSAQLHDVGKIAISDLILNKPEKLPLEEWDVMRSHVAIGVDAIKKIEQNTDEHAFLRHARRFIAAHHEKWDGTGYPAGLSGQDIPLEGRLMAIADVYDALISARPYKEPLSAETAKQIIVDGRGTHFDPVLVDVFSAVADQFAAVAGDL